MNQQHASHATSPSAGPHAPLATHATKAPDSATRTGVGSCADTAQHDGDANHLDVLVIGAGPAGMEAAIAAANHGLRVRLLDDQPDPGGQIYRAITRTDAARQAILGPDYSAGQALAQGFAQSSVEYWRDTAVWQITRNRQVHVLRQGASRVLSADHIVLATGAQERPFPIPGWTLPGVMTAGAAQILLKSEGAVPAQPAILAGCGPLLYLLAWQYLQAGIPLQAIVQTTPPGNTLRALRHLPALAAGWSDLKKGLHLIRALKRQRIPIYRHATGLRVTGDTCATGVQFITGARQVTLAAPLVLLHQGIVPNTQATWALRAQHHWNAVQHAWVPATDNCGALDIPGFYVVGDGAGIVGARTAALQGRLAGLAIAKQHGAAQVATQDTAILTLQRQIQRQRTFRLFLETLYEPAHETRVPDDATIVCRCENVTAGDIRQQLVNGSTDPNQVKSFTRCGMGPCQGRQCGLTVTEIIASHHNVPAANVGYYRLRPPLRPITLAELASESHADVPASTPTHTPAPPPGTPTGRPHHA